jgi:hypothetical protein
MNDADRSFAIRVAIVTLATLLLGGECVLLYGLFDTRVDNQQIFGLLSPVINMIVGAFIGVIASSRPQQQKEPPQP